MFILRQTSVKMTILLHKQAKVSFSLSETVDGKSVPLCQGNGSSQEVADLETSISGLTDLRQTLDKGGKPVISFCEIDFLEFFPIISFFGKKSHIFLLFVQFLYSNR